MYGGKEKRTESLSVCQKVRRMTVSGNSLSRTAEEKTQPGAEPSEKVWNCETGNWDEGSLFLPE